MDTIHCIETRRSVRKFTEEPVPDDIIQQLLTLGTKAASARNAQPWGFVVLSGKAEIDALSEQIRSDLLANFDQLGDLKVYERWIRRPTYHFFFHSSALILIYGNTASRYYVEDCTLAAANIMLSAHAMGLGSCWIGFAKLTCESDSFKMQYHVPDEFSFVAAITLGYPVDPNGAPMTKKEPVVFNRDAQ